MAQLAAGAIVKVANFAALPAHIPGIYMVRVTADDGQAYISDGSNWRPLGSGGNVDGGNATSIYGGSIVIDGGGAT